MYIPHGKNIHCYDVNSLYPYVMSKYEMPVGNITFFEGNILDINSNAYGFFEVEVTTPKNLKHPILQTKLKLDSSTRTLAPLGSWKTFIYSEEMYNAIKLG